MKVYQLLNESVTSMADFHDKESDHHSAASVAASKEDYPAGEKLHDRAVSAHEAAARAHRSGAANANELSDVAKVASKKADDAFDRKKREILPDKVVAACIKAGANVLEFKEKFQTIKVGNPKDLKICKDVIARMGSDAKDYVAYTA